MKLIERYIFGRLLKAFLLTELTVAVSVWMIQAMNQFDLITAQGQSAFVFLRITVLLVPDLMTLVTPVALLIAVIYSFNALNRDSELVVIDPSATLGEGAITPWSGAHVADFFQRLLNALGQELGFDLDTPWEELPAKVRKSILEGHPTKVHVRHRNRYGRERSYWTAFEGVRPYIERRHREAESDTSRERFEGYMREVPCPVCAGSRLKPASMAVTLGGLNIAELCAMSIDETE